MAVNRIKNILSGSFKKNTSELTIPYTGNLFEFSLAGNPRTDGGSQIENWQSPGVLKIRELFQKWDQSSPMNIALPNEGKGEIALFHDLLKGPNLPKKLPDMGYFSLYKSSKLTDFVTGTILNQYGWIVSLRAKTILEKFNLGKHRFYPVILEHQSVKFHDYFFLKILANGNDFIDIEKSEFYSQQQIEYGSNEGSCKREFNTQKEIDLFLEQYKQTDHFNSEFVYAEPLRLSEDFPKYDLFYLRKFMNPASVFMSERLKKELEQLSGIEFWSSKRVELL